MFVERYEAPLDGGTWQLQNWVTANTYYYGLTAGSAYGGDAGIRFEKRDAGSGSYINPTHLSHYETPGLQGDLYLRYRVRFRRGTGDVAIFPIQIHRNPMVGTLAELIIEDPGPTLVLQCTSSNMFLRGSVAPPLAPDVWHLMQIDLVGVGTANGTCRGRLDGVEFATLTGLDWTTSRVSQLLTGFGAVNDGWRGDYDLDDVVLLSQPRAAVMNLSGPPQVDAGECMRFEVTCFTAADGGRVGPPNVSPIVVTATGADVFSDLSCGLPWPASGVTTNDGTIAGTFRAHGGSDCELTASAPDLLGSTLKVVVASVPDAGEVDAGAPDAGPPDAGEHITSSQRLAVGCDCSQSSIEPLWLLFTAWLARRRSARRESARW